jgi:hypothetical protein
MFVVHCLSLWFFSLLFSVLQFTAFDYFFDILKLMLTLLWKQLSTQSKDVHTLCNNCTIHKCLQNKYGGNRNRMLKECNVIIIIINSILIFLQRIGKAYWKTLHFICMLFSSFYMILVSKMFSCKIYTHMHVFLTSSIFILQTFMYGTVIA